MCHKDVVASSIVSNLCRSAPFLNVSSLEAEENRIESWEKEIAATQVLDRHSILDYDVWFSEALQDISKPMSPQLRPCRATNLRIRKAFQEWKDSFKGHVFYPQLQANKTVSQSSSRLYYEAIYGSDYGRINHDVTSADLEKFYAQTGREIGGPCELRQSWKYNDLTPRTYFAQGGKAYHASKYIREIAKSLCNAFPETHFVSRFSINDLDLTSDHTAFIYDYTSFTSNLAELKYFLDQLADFTDDIDVMIVDSFEGVLNTTLGALIREYNAVCNIYGEFTVNRYHEDDTTIWIHKLAGFLGVYGNIAFSTALHGLYACQVCGDTGGCKCVGDDVVAVAIFEEDFGMPETISAIQGLGEVHTGKFRWWTPVELGECDDDRAWPYVKRPLDRLENRLYLEPALFLPIFGLAVPIADGIHDTEDDPYLRTKILAVQTRALIRQARALYPPLEDHQKELLRQYLRALYSATETPLEGRLPFETFTCHRKNISGLFVPSILPGFLDVDPWELLEERYGNRPDVFLSIPKMVREVFVEMKEILVSMDPVESCMDRRLAYMRNMSWVEAIPLTEIRFLDFPEYRLFYESLFAGELHAVYEFRKTSECPMWTPDLLYVM